MRIALVGTVVVFAGCGDTAVAPDATPDAAATVDVVPECHNQDQGSDPFASGADFSPAVPGTLAGWDPAGRWFLTGIKVGSISSFHFERQGDAVIVDRDHANLGTMDDTEIFQRYSFNDDNGTAYIVAKRVSNRGADGSLRAERAVCDGGQCHVCTAKLVRATHNANEGEGEQLQLVGQLNDPTWGAGYTFNVRVVGTIAYLIRQDGLHMIETSDPAHPAELGHWRRSTDGYSNDVKLVDTGTRRYAFIADSPVDIVDVTDPALPVFVGQIGENAHTLAVEHRNNRVYAYFGNYDGTAPIYDVTDPTSPQKIATYSTQSLLVHDLSVENGIAYLNAWSQGFLAVDFTTPTNPHLLGTWGPTPTRTSHSNWTTTVAGRHIALHGEEAYGAHLSLLDVDPASATFMKPFAEWKTRDFISIHNLMAFGSKAYFSYYQDGIRVLDLADPTHPVQVGYYNTWDPQADYTTSAFFEGSVGLDVDLGRKLIFVADSPRGLLILHDDT